MPDITIVPEQQQYRDSNFPAHAYRPGVKARPWAFALAGKIRRGYRSLATDPDADRVGVPCAVGRQLSAAFHGN